MAVQMRVVMTQTMIQCDDPKRNMHGGHAFDKLTPTFTTKPALNTLLTKNPYIVIRWFG